MTEKERAELSRLAHGRAVAVRLAQRAQIVDVAREGEPVAASATALGVGAATVRLWLKRCNAAGVRGLRDAPRSGRPATYTPEQIGEVIATALTDPQTVGQPFGCWTVDRLQVYLNEARQLPIKRSRMDAVLLAAGRRWRRQATWFGERAALEADADQREVFQSKRKEHAVDPDFAQTRGQRTPLYLPTSR